MSIQSTINQGLSVAALLIGQNPEIQAMAQKRSHLSELGKKENVLREQYRQASGKSKPTEVGDPEDLQLDTLETLVDPPDLEEAERISSQLSDIAQERFEIDPSRQTYETALGARYGQHEGLEQEAGRVSAFRRNLEEQRSRMEENQRRELEAQEATAAAQESRRKARRVFTEYLADEPVSIAGQEFGTFGSLPRSLQREAAKSYSRRERREIMDRKDAENE